MTGIWGNSSVNPVMTSRRRAAVVQPPILIAARGPEAGELAGRIGDGLINHEPKPEPVQAFVQAGGQDKPKYGQMKVCRAPDEAQAKKTAREWWPNAGLNGPLNVELALPEHDEQASQDVTEEEVAQKVVCGPDPARHIAEIQQYAEAGYDHVFVTQAGPDQEGFFRFYERDVLPNVR